MQANHSLKRPRQGESDDDDDISLVSRSPSPRPGDAMIVDSYDEGTSHERITVDTKLKPTNRGFAMLAKLGWAEGQPLGLSAEARVEPVPFQLKSDFTGVGKISQDVRMIETTVSQRRELDSERMTKETEEQRRQREDEIARRSAIAHQVSDTLKAFYCSLCDKQFKNVAQYDEHTNSYAHHHKARFRDMQQNVRIKPQEEVDKRKEKERKREEKELRKIAAANGIRVAKASTVTLVSAETPAEPSQSTPNAPSSGGFKKVGGWSSVSPPSTEVYPHPPSAAVASSSSVFKKVDGWAAVAPSNDAAASSFGVKAGGWAPVVPTEHGPPALSGFQKVGVVASSFEPSSLISTPVATSTPSPEPPSISHVAEAQASKATASRMGWQQFKKSNARH